LSADMDVLFLLALAATTGWLWYLGWVTRHEE
jgi:hypothetical protein